jgi:hypothetical protein
MAGELKGHGLCDQRCCGRGIHTKSLEQPFKRGLRSAKSRARDPEDSGGDTEHRKRGWLRNRLDAYVVELKRTEDRLLA